MDTQRFVVGPLSALCIVALVMGTASAAIMTAGGTSDTDTGPVHHHLTPESIISELEQQGVDVTEVKTLLQNGDTDAVKAWLDNYFQSNKPAMPDGSGHSPPDLTNATQQQEIITRLEEKGVDVTEAEAELESGDTSAVRTWLDNYFHAHEGEMPSHHPCGEPPTEIPSGTSSQSNE